MATHGRLGDLAVTGSSVPEGAEVAVEVSLEAVEGAIIVRGRVSAPWVGECRRCLAALGGDVDAALEEVFVQGGGDGDTRPIVRDQIDLEPAIREAVVLGMPLVALCRADCQGLCPTCGAELNLGPCGCAGPPPDTRWAALDPLHAEE